jgi:uncharacterized protein YijF (DUF1287 family)
MKRRAIFGLAAVLVIVALIVVVFHHVAPSYPPIGTITVSTAHFTPFQKAVVRDLHRQIAARIWYQDGYYAGGDPPAHVGVCTDVVIRSYRAAGVNLQRLVAEDVAANPSVYHISRPDPNIDQRRCKNLSLFFRRKAIILPTQGNNADWQPGDIVFWDTSGNYGIPDHVGVIADHLDTDGVPTVVHHWPGQFVAEQDWLYKLPVVYHFRWPAQRARPGTRTAHQPFSRNSLPSRSAKTT